MPPIPWTKGQRPPPFDGPPTAVSSGGESWQDPLIFNRLKAKLLHILEEIERLNQWSIEVLGMREELRMRYRIFEEVATFRPGQFKEIQARHDNAVERCNRLEDEFFSKGVQIFDDAITIWIESGWIGSADPKTPKILSAVRANLLTVCTKIRNWKSTDRVLLPPQDLVAEIDEQVELLFRISGPDEITWRERMSMLADAARALKDRAYKLAEKPG